MGLSRSEIGDLPHNNRVNPSVGPVTGLANCARPAPVPPAGYLERWTHEECAAEYLGTSRTMNNIASLAVVFLILLPSPAASQTPTPPSPPKTKLEAFEAQEGVVIVQGFTKMGELRGTYGGSVSVSAKEFTNAATGRRESGIVIDVKEAGRLERSSRSFIDYDEIAPLLKGIDYIGKVEKSVTKLENFQADYRTKGDLHVSTFNTSGGEVMVAVSSGRIGAASAHFKFADLAALRNLILSSKERLDAIKQ